MSFQFPAIDDSVIEQFSKACRVVCLSGNGDIRSQVREAITSAPNAGQDFLPIHDEQNRFRHFGYQVAGEQIAILGTWYAGSRDELDATTTKIRTTPFQNEKEKAASRLAGKVVFLAAAVDATNHITGLRIVTDTNATFALFNQEGLNGQKVIQTRVRDGADIASISGLSNELSADTQILVVRPSVAFAHAVEHSLGLCGVRHG
jgi:hypothetical protein